jgi:hypothetical protein
VFGDVDRSPAEVERKPGVILDYDQDWNLVSLEILDASTRFTEARRFQFETTG